MSSNPSPHKRIAAAVREIIEAIGENPEREGISGTPDRVAEMYLDLFSGINQEPGKVLETGFEEGHREMIILRNVSFHSLCEHHLLPFYGAAHIGYIPRGRITGISKLVHALEILAKRPQLQERLTSQLAEVIVETLNPAGVMVVIEAEHLCMIMRGVKKSESKVLTSATRGVFRSRAVTRGEFLSLIKGNQK